MVKYLFQSSLGFWLLLTAIAILFEPYSRAQSMHDNSTISRNGGIRRRKLDKPQPRIINGDVVDRLRFPYFSLMYGKSLCGAVLIGPRLILGAAHCKDSADRFRIGAFENPYDGQTMEIKSTITHPDYDEESFDNDIMIFQLEEDARHQYVKLEREPVDGGRYTVVGFGDVDKGPDLSLPNVLHEVELKYVDNDDCDYAHGNKGQVRSHMLCMGGGKRDACIGDSGGPLIKMGSDYYEDTLVGLVSWGRGCAEEGVPGVYIRISYFYDWIVKTACKKFPYDAPYYMECIPSTDEPSPMPTPTPTTSEPTKTPTIEPTNSAPVAPTRPPLSMTTSPPSSNVTITAEEREWTTTKSIDFIAWTPKEVLEECQGDCDIDYDCVDDLVCYKRRGLPSTNTVPGCEGADSVPDNIDVCVDPALLN